MSEFELLLDEKMSVWRRTYVTIEAENINGAISKCLDGDCEISDSEYLYETEEYMSPDECKGSTVEIYSNDNECDPLYTNDNTIRAYE